MYFSYDASGTPTSILYDGTTYYYVTNLQGDVVGIVNQNGNIRVSYTYDAWGNLLSTTGGRATTVGKYNPLRYRGYVYDRETSLYYLQSRYYDPEVGRFINADAFASTGQGVLGNNMLAYCNNSPIGFADPSGDLPKFITGIVNRAREIAEEVEEKTSRINATVSKGKVFGISFGITGVTLNPCVSFDARGNVELQLSYSWGITTAPGWISVSTGNSTLITNAPSVEKLRGKSGVLGCSKFVLADGIPIPFGGGWDLVLIPDDDQNKMYYGLSSMLGISTSADFEFHVGPSDTIPIVQVNVFDVFYSICDWILGE